MAARTIGMRAIGLVVVAFVVFVFGGAGVAHADMTMPATRAEPKWVATCEARLQHARDDAAAILPIFNLAHVYGADLYLDENILGSVTPVLFEAGVLPTREPALVAYNLDRWATRAQIARVLNDVFKPAIDECVRAAASE